MPTPSDLHQTTLNSSATSASSPTPGRSTSSQADHPRLLLNCCRQAGKSTTVAVLALAEALFVPCRASSSSRAAIASRTELFRIVVDFYRRLATRPAASRRTADELELTNLSRIVCLPCREDTIRGFAARRPADHRRGRPRPRRPLPRRPPHARRLQRPARSASPRPTASAASSTTPGPAAATTGTASRSPPTRSRASPPEFLDEERRALGESWFRQEYCCSFEALEGLVYPDFARCVVAPPPRPRSSPPHGRPASAASTSASATPSPPSGASSTATTSSGSPASTTAAASRSATTSATCRATSSGTPTPPAPPRSPSCACAGFNVRQGNNAIRPGIAAVTARLEDGTLQSPRRPLPQPPRAKPPSTATATAADADAEAPVDEHNHALAALRYLIAAIDGRMARRPKLRDERSESRGSPQETAADKEARRYWQIALSEDDHMWQPLWRTHAAFTSWRSCDSSGSAPSAGSRRGGPSLPPRSPCSTGTPADP